MTLAIHVLGWALVHLLWQGALIALLAAGALRLLRSASSQARYVAACGALASMLASPAMTARQLYVAGRVPLVSMQRTEPAEMLARPAGENEPAPLRASPESETLFQKPVLERFLVGVVAAWLVGVVILALRLCGGWWRVRRLRRLSFAAGPSIWQARGSSIASRLGLRRAVHFVDCPSADVPGVVGWLRPAILLPIAAIATLTPEQVEAILAHELAHVRRHDFLINGVQTIAETLLFYHPAVHWISRQIRIERENCCDDIVVWNCGDAVGYADALTELASWQATRHALTLSATDGQLLGRVRRLLNSQRHDESGVPVAAAIVCFLALANVMILGSAYIASANGPAPVFRAAGHVASLARDEHVLTSRPLWSPAGAPTPGLRPSAGSAIFLQDARADQPWEQVRADVADIFYSRRLAREVSVVQGELSRAYQQVSADLRHELSFKPALVLYGTRLELEQSVAAGTVPERREHILLSLDGAVDRISGRLRHELTHSFIFDIFPPPMQSNLSVWVSEGLADHERDEWDPLDRQLLADQVAMDSLPNLTALARPASDSNLREHRILGHAAFDFIESRWGKDGIRRLLFVLRQNGGGATDAACQSALGVAASVFDREFSLYVRQQFVPGA